VCNFIFLEELTEPLQHLPSIFVIHLPNHYVTLVADGEKYYFHDSLLPKPKVKVPGMVNKIHDALKVWYTDNAATVPQSIVLKLVKAKVIKEDSPLQEDSWSCGIHAHIVILATIYQGKKPVLQYTRKHAYTLSRAHLHWELTGEILPCIADIVNILRLTVP
jgi:Ulp1 family protease